MIEPGTAVLEARDVAVTLGGRDILRNADLDLSRGEVVALVGPNGAGKSTLLAALSADVRAAGSITLNGKPLASLTELDLARQRSVLPQQVNVSFPFTVRELVLMGRAPWSGTSAEDDDESVVAQAMLEMEVDHLAQRRFPTLSGGERARVTLARVFAQMAPIIFLDEPTAALDVHHQEMVMGLLRTRARAGGAVLVVLHDLALAAAHVDRLVLLEDGSTVADGPPAHVLTEDLLSRVYRHDLEVIRHPVSGLPLVNPRRAAPLD